MKYLKSYKQPTDISALLGRHKKVDETAECVKFSVLIWDMTKEKS
jgi:hypothetical protein